MPQRTRRLPRTLAEFARMLPTAPGLRGSKQAILIASHQNAVSAQQEPAQPESVDDADQAQQWRAGRNLITGADK